MELSVIVVHSSPSLRKFLKATVAAMGNQVVVAESDKQGLSFLESNQADLIIVEQPLLELEAANFITQVKLIPGHEQTPVVVIAASKDNEAKKQVRSAGGAGWLVQPLQPQQFIRMLEGFKARKAKKESETKS